MSIQQEIAVFSGANQTGGWPVATGAFLGLAFATLIALASAPLVAASEVHHSGENIVAKSIPPINGTLEAISASVPISNLASKVYSLRIEVEPGLSFDDRELAEFVLATLNDRRSWARDGYSFVQTNSKYADGVIVLASPNSSAKMCLPLRTFGKLSCRNGKMIALTNYRWEKGASDFHGDLIAYRQYLINHEVGHLLGKQHLQCRGAGKLAPVMMQQTKSTGTCKYNAWPYPDR